MLEKVAELEVKNYNRKVGNEPRYTKVVTRISKNKEENNNMSKIL